MDWIKSGGYWQELLGGRLQDGHVGKSRAVSGDPNVIFGKNLGIFQLDLHLLALFSLDINNHLGAVGMQTLALDRHKILTGRNSGDRDPMIGIRSINFKNNTGACMIETIENDQNAILVVVVCSYLIKLESNGTSINESIFFCGSFPGYRSRTGVSKGCYGDQQAGEVEGYVFHKATNLTSISQLECQNADSLQIRAL